MKLNSNRKFLFFLGVCALNCCLHATEMMSTYKNIDKKQDVDVKQKIENPSKNIKESLLKGEEQTQVTQNQSLISSQNESAKQSKNESAKQSQKSSPIAKNIQAIKVNLLDLDVQSAQASPAPELSASVKKRKI